MKIPNKITPDRVKDAIVEIRFNPNLPFEVIVGYIYQVICEKFQYTTIPPNSLDIFNQLKDKIDVRFDPINLFYNENIKFQLKQNSIIFSNFKSNSYIGWNKYFSEIKNVVTFIAKTDVLNFYNRVGIRYISEYPDINLNNCINFSFSFGFPTLNSSSYSFKSDFEIENKRVVLNLHNNVKIIHKTIQAVSHIDIDIIQENLEISKDNLQELFSTIENSHDLQKQVFFSLLKEDFLKTLNPEY